MLTKKKKTVLIGAHKRHDTDTGSPEVQIAVLSERINELTSHLKKNKKDNHSRRGLLGMVAKRRTHLKYLEKNDKKRYDSVMKKLEGGKKARTSK
jgi:small subunit ribosomal protein S15